MKLGFVAALLIIVSIAPLAAQPAASAQSGKWAQDYTGRQADPAVRFGTLPNGLRYAIMHNETPSDGVAMRLRIGSGSLQESDDEQGLAHFLEHMAFRGSTNIADGQIVQMLQRQGLAFGADTNAETRHEETVYKFNFPKADATALDTGLTLFREIGGRLNLAPSAIEAERGVILSEERLRDTAAFRVAKAQLATMLAGTRAVERWPIGKVETIRSANHDLLERYYRANYRPDNATIVVVGNIDTIAVEHQIKLRFSGWVGAVTPEAEAEPEPEGAVRPEGGVTTQGAVRAAPEPVNLGTPSGQKKAGEFVAAGVPDLLSLSWVGPADRRAETETVDREMLLKGIGLLVLNQKLADRALEPGTPYVAAQAQLSPSLLDSASVTAINVAVPAGKWLPALDEVTAEERMLLRDGVSAGDLKRALASLRTALETRTKQAATRKSARIADEIVAAANDDKLFVSPAQELAFAAPILAVLTPTQVNAGLNQLFAAHGPILFRSAQQEPAGEAKLAQALEGAYTRPLGAATAAAALSWPYDNFGKPGAIVAKTADAKLGTTLVRFANGTRLMVKPTQFEGDRISVAVLLGNGRSGVRPALARAIWESSLFPLAGTKKLPLFQITQWAQQSGKVITLGMDAGIRAFVLRGQTRPADLLTEMQLLAAYARDPGFRSEAAEKAKALAPTLAGQIAASAQETYARASQALMAGNDPRFESVPSAADLASVTSDDLPQLLRQSLASQADVIMVGDVTVDQAIQAVQATFGAGSAGQPVAAQPAHVSIPNGRAEPYVVEHEGRADQAFYGEYFRLPDYFADPKISEAADVAAAIISSRLVDSVREQLGITYSPQVHAVTSIELPGQGYLGITLETPPANFAKFHALLSDTLRDLATKPVAADELARAKQPLIQTERKKRETNGFWLGSLAQIMREPRAEGEVVGKLDKISAVSAADVQALIGRYVAGHQPVAVIARAKGAH